MILNSDDGTTLGPDLTDASPDPEATYLRKEEARIVSAAIRHLRPGMRRAVELAGNGRFINPGDSPADGALGRRH